MDLSPEQDTAVDGPETFNLVVTNTAGISASGLGTIKDDGTGDIFLGNNNTSTSNSPGDTDPNGPDYPVNLDDDRVLAVNDISINENSPYAVFTVTGVAGQKVQLALGNTSADNTDRDASLGADTANAGSSVPLQYFDGSGWVDYTASSYVTIPDGGTTLLVRTAIVDDTAYEIAETFTLTATNTGGTSITGTATIHDDGTGQWFDGTSGTGSNTAPTGSVLDDDMPIVSITSTTASATEGGTSPANALVYTVSQNNLSTVDTTVHVGVSTSTVNAVDISQIVYTNTSGTVITLTNSTDIANFFTSGVDIKIIAGSTNAPTITFTAINDSIYEISETLNLVVSNPTNATVNTTVAAGIIYDNSANGSDHRGDKPVISITATDDNAVENTSNDKLSFQVSQSNVSNFDTTVVVTLSLGTVETADLDSIVTYVDASGVSTSTTVSALISGLSITIPASTTYAPIFTFTTLDDNLYEVSEAMSMSISLARGESDATISTTADSSTVTIYDEDGLTLGDHLGDKPVLTFSDATIAEGGIVEFIGGLSKASASDEVITLTATIGTASTTDFNTTKTSWIVTYIDSNSVTQILSVDSSGQFTLPAGITDFKVKILTTSDSIYEGAETFTLSANATSTYIADSDTAIGTILDAIVTNEDTTYIFSSSDFGITSQTTVQITSLPENGDIYLDGIIVSTNQIINLTDISSGKLSFVPTSQTDDDSSFKFKVDSGSELTLNVAVIAVADLPSTSITVTADTTDNLPISINGSGLATNITYISSSTNAYSSSSTLDNKTTASFTNIKAGVVYSTSFDYIDVSSVSDSGKIDVKWGGILVATIDGDNTMSHTLTLDLVGGAGDGLNKLEFIASGTETGAGMTISNIIAKPIENMLEYNVNLAATLNVADTADLSETLTIKLSGYAEGTTFSVGSAEMTSQFDVVLNAYTMKTTGNWIIPLPVSTDDTFLNTGIKMYVPESAGTFTLTSTAIATEAHDNSSATATATSSAVDYSINAAPTSSNDTITIDEDTTYTFTVTDFGDYADDSGLASFTSIMITALPTSGTIRLLGHDKMGSNANVSIGDVITLTDLNLGNLIFIPNSQYSNCLAPDTNFTFKVSDGRAYSADSYTTSISINAVADMPTISLNIGSAVHTAATSGTLSITDSFNNQTATNWTVKDSLDNTVTATYSSNGNNGNNNTDYALQLLSNQKASVTYTGFEANTTVTLNFTTDVSGNSWGTSGNHFIIKANNSVVLDKQLNDDLNNDVLNARNGTPYTATADASGNITFEFFCTSSTYIDLNYFTVSGTSAAGVQAAYETYAITILNTGSVDRTGVLNGSETLGDVTLTGIPTGSTLYANGSAVAVASNIATLTQAQITAGNITLKIPSIDSQEFSLTASVKSTESCSSSIFATATAIAEHVTVDTTPKTTNVVADLVTTSSVTSGSNTNIVVIMDVSGSMSTNDGTGARLALAKTAINNMIDSYSAVGTVNVNLTSFQATATSYGWFSSTTAAKNAINGLTAGGYTNYEDALYKTYTGYVNTNPSAKTIVLFVSDGEPTKENLEGADVSGNIGLDAQNGWLDTTYKTAWQTFVNANVNELKVVGIGSGLTNTTYLSQVAEGISSSVITDVVHLKNTADLATYVAPNVDSISGNVLSNIDYKADGAGGIKSIVIGTTTYHSNVSGEVTALSNGVNTKSSGEYGKLTFDFTTGNYKYTTANATTVDRTESFAITVADADGDTSSFNLNVQVFSTASEYTYAGTTYDAGAGLDSLILGTGININFDSVANIDNFEQIDLTKDGNHTLSNIELQDILDITNSNKFLSILGDSGDIVSLKNTTTTQANTWSKSNTTVDANGFDTYVNSGNNAVSLKIDKDISVSII